MGRQTLRITIVLGMLVTLLGGTGIFASFTDEATTGTNTVTSGSRPHAADLQINLAVQDPTTGEDCNQDPDADGIIWSDNLVTGIISATSMQPGDTSFSSLPAGTPPTIVCLRNAGSGGLDISASVIDLVDTDIDCTGDELAAGDTTCGLDPLMVPQQGELSSVLTVLTEVMPDCNGMFQNSFSTNLNDYSAVPAMFPAGSTLLPGQLLCLQLSVDYPAGTPEASVQVAQSDQATFRFAFDGSAQ